MPALSGTYTVNIAKQETETGRAGGEQAVLDDGIVVSVRVHTYDDHDATEIAKLIKDTLEKRGIRPDDA